MNAFPSKPTLAELRERLKEAQQRVRTLKQELADEEHDARQLGYEASAQRSDLIAGDLRRAEAHLAAVQAEVSKAESHAAAERQAAEQRAEIERRRSIPVLAAEHMALATKAWQAASEAGDALRALFDSAERLSAALGGGDEARRLIGPTALRLRIAPLFWKLFHRPPPIKAAAEGLGYGTGGAWRQQDNLLDMPTPGFGPDVKRTFPDVEQDRLDVIVRIFATRAEAEAARDRIDPVSGRDMLHVLPDPRSGLYHLVEGRRRGTAANDDQPSPAA